ncbi:MmcQ/YjbR family DNA-binding protein [Luteimonas sp. SX5]|uniref:MmcQ/YjbR family DNA-binding protein n=1 Tax=Luteimonas galliterrae TaxID=2940486 RepID=A0ABT0MKU1_9GAMM|nr:MmcQ/YjbR family DNA-binding protein [Luteimonas galliterrae]MCL1635505.1 MmcQ/YjbR family DNA-binding protein [Luteimonas galliterrae]
MDTAQLKKFCAALPGAAARQLDEPMNVLVYSVGDKTFAYFKTSEPERWRFSFRASPERFIELTDVPGIKPARWMGRYRWVTVVDVRTVPAAYLRELVEWSHGDALGKLSRKRRNALLGIEAAPATGDRRPARRVVRPAKPRRAGTGQGDS